MALIENRKDVATAITLTFAGSLLVLAGSLPVLAFLAYVLGMATPLTVGLSVLLWISYLIAAVVARMVV